MVMKSKPPEVFMKSPLRKMQSLAVITVMSIACSIPAAELRTEHTYRLAENETPPTATLEDASWLVGSWTGTAFGQTFEEVWNPASAGSMVGLFKLMGEDSVNMYEIMLMTVDDGRLSLKVKHFNPDFTAWEEKEDYVNFKLVKMEPDALHFAGISFYRRDENHIDAYIVMREKDGVKEYELKYTRRVQSGSK
jgi:hypothetical protein